MKTNRPTRLCSDVLLISDAILPSRHFARQACASNPSDNRQRVIGDRLWRVKRNQWVQIFAELVSKGYTWIIQPPACGTNRPPARWHSDSSEMVPLKPNC